MKINSEFLGEVTISSESTPDEIRRAIYSMALEYKPDSASIETFRFLLDLIGDPNPVPAYDSEGNSVLHWAALSGWVEAMELLLDRGADMEQRSNSGRTPLHNAGTAKRNNLEVAKLLLIRGAELDAVDKYGHTPLHGAAYHGQTDVAEILLDRGARVDAVNDQGITPLHHAVYWDQTDVARLLLDRGAGVDPVNNQGITPLRGAVLHFRADVAKLLIQRGADAFKAFDDPLKIIEFFKGDIDWMPEGLKTKLMRAKRSRQAFGM